jgi:hypothetical protein
MHAALVVLVAWVSLDALFLAVWVTLATRHRRARAKEMVGVAERYANAPGAERVVARL